MITANNLGGNLMRQYPKRKNPMKRTSGNLAVKASASSLDKRQKK